MILRGKVHKYGANVDTDAIVPGKYLNTSDPLELAQHCMEDLDAHFRKRVQPGDMVLAETNFGCGSSREHAPLAMKASGISCIIAMSFARIFFRNCINLGLRCLESRDAVDHTEAGDTLEVDLGTGEIRNLTKGRSFKATSYPDFMMDITNAGGLIPYTRSTL